jgi:hypothetical protein
MRIRLFSIACLVLVVSAHAQTAPKVVFTGDSFMFAWQNTDQCHQPASGVCSYHDWCFCSTHHVAVFRALGYWLDTKPSCKRRAFG